MSRVVVHRDAIARAKKEAHRHLLQLGEDIGDDAQANIRAMGLVVSGRLLNSKSVDQDAATGAVRVGFTAPYAAFTQEGTDDEDPNPFFSRAVFKRRTP